MVFEELIKSISEKPLRVIGSAINLNSYTKIDLSVYNKSLDTIDISLASNCTAYINNYLQAHDARVAYGGYLEERNLYKGGDNFIGEEQRTIHLGIDLWCDAGTKVLAVLDGEIHSFQNNNNQGDYGPTIILKHSFSGAEFYSLYGHLSLDSLHNCEIGERVAQGEVIGILGSPEINGGYAPHLHFQIIKDLHGNIGDYHGVCNKENLSFYKKNCPDPNLLLKLK